jgi:hypothetical protein
VGQECQVRFDGSRVRTTSAANADARSLYI